jgi:hypothetical protein
MLHDPKFPFSDVFYLVHDTKITFLLIFNNHKFKNFQNNEISQLAYLSKSAPIIIFELVGRFVEQWDMLEENFLLILKIQKICISFSNFCGISTKY